jgi:D-hexose-6-phosphate mutarotase
MFASLRQFAIPGLIAFDQGQGGLPRVQITTSFSRAEIYLHGAQVTGFCKTGERPLLFLSASSRFEAGKAIRGGIPICFPWFGPRPGQPSHGFARLNDWELVQSSAGPRGEALLRFVLPQPTSGSSEWPSFKAELAVTVAETLTLELNVTNQSGDQPFVFENCFHTYFAVSDIARVSIVGLKSAIYLDKLDKDAKRVDQEENIRVAKQIDRTYLDTTNDVDILDQEFGRRIRIQKSGSSSTVVWNPWTTQALPDLGADEYRRMVCVESGNIERNHLSLRPGETAALRVVLSSTPWNT